MAADWSPVSGPLRAAVRWRDRNVASSDVSDPLSVHFLDQRLAAVRAALARHGVDVDDPDQVHAAVAGVIFAWDFSLALSRRTGSRPAEPASFVLALEALARFAPEEVLAGG